jgi:hypothetical protein
MVTGAVKRQGVAQFRTYVLREEPAVMGGRAHMITVPRQRGANPLLCP